MTESSKLASRDSIDSDIVEVQIKLADDSMTQPKETVHKNSGASRNLRHKLGISQKHIEKGRQVRSSKLSQQGSHPHENKTSPIKDNNGVCKQPRKPPVSPSKEDEPHTRALISPDRLLVPAKTKKNQPLVTYDIDSDDELPVRKPAKNKTTNPNKGRKLLTDDFDIEGGDSSDSESGDLDLIPPKPHGANSCVCCKMNDSCRVQ